MNGLLIWGAGGHAKVVLDVARAAGNWDGIAFLDDAGGETDRTFLELPLFGGRDRLAALRDGGYRHFLIAIGHNGTRAACFSEALAHGLLPATAIHPTAVVSPSAVIGAGTVVMPRAVINAAATIGVGCIINSGAIVEHDCAIGEHAHISPGAVLGGGVTIGRLAHVGLNASVLPLAEIGASAIVGAGAVVLKSAPAGRTTAGVPARPI